MLVIGLDAASDFGKFGYAVGLYEKDQMRIEQAGLLEGAGQNNTLDSVLVPRLRATDKALIAIDAPLGWPAQMANELKTHQAGEAFTTEKDVLFQRETDRHVREILGKKPLEVGADRIARAAYSALDAINQIRKKSGKAIPLAWKSKVSRISAIEVYPAGTLKARSLPDTGYKKKEQIEVRRQISSALEKEIVGLKRYTKGSIDVFDACLCLAAAKDFLEGLAVPPKNLRLARVEGWIWVRKPTT